MADMNTHFRGVAGRATSVVENKSGLFLINPWIARGIGVLLGIRGCLFLWYPPSPQMVVCSWVPFDTEGGTLKRRATHFCLTMSPFLLRSVRPFLREVFLAHAYLSPPMYQLLHHAKVVAARRRWFLPQVESPSGPKARFFFFFFFFFFGSWHGWSE